LQKWIRFQSTSILIAILTTIVVVGIVVTTGTLLHIFGFVSGTLTWVTMAVEVWIGVFIATSIYILQEKTSGSIKELVEEQKELRAVVKLRSLDRIDGYLSMALNFLHFDRDTITNAGEPSKLGIVESFERLKDRQFDTRIHIIEQLKKESDFVREYEKRVELEDNLRGIDGEMKYLYGLSFSFQQNKVQSWINICDVAIRLAERTKGLIQEIRNEGSKN
jgi:hypothetical protein